jgi:hypothetical protein
MTRRNGRSKRQDREGSKERLVEQSIKIIAVSAKRINQSANRSNAELPSAQNPEPKTTTGPSELESSQIIWTEMKNECSIRKSAPWTTPASNAHVSFGSEIAALFYLNSVANKPPALPSRSEAPRFLSNFAQ